MKKIIVFFGILVLIASCASDDNGVDCSLVLCTGGDSVQLVFLSNNQNIFETNPPTAITIFQNNSPLEFSVTIDNHVNFIIGEDGPIQINIDDEQFNIEVSSTFVQGECCSGIRIDTIIANNSQICNNKELCDDVLEINID